MTSVGDPNRRLTPLEVAELHQQADTDSQQSAIHHTLGPSGIQASPGNHSHNGRDSRVIDSLANPSTPVGSITMFAATNPPEGWLICNGHAVSREVYGVLFAVIGLAFGVGDNTTTFNVPDMRDRFPVGAGSTYSVNTKGGATTVALDTNSMPSHSHSASASSSTDTQGYHGHSAGASTSVYDAGSHQHYNRDEGSGSTPGTAGGVQYVAAGAGTAYRWDDPAGSHSHSAGTSVQVYDAGSHAHNTSTGVSVNNAGGNGSHENRPPYIGINFIIKA